MSSRRQRIMESPKVKQHKQKHHQAQMLLQIRQPQQLGESLKNLVIIPSIFFTLRILKIIMKT
eukprot:8996281-Ditylum_brightwellii.AAC.1